MKPTPTLCARLRFSTKDVGRGFYRGNRTGSMGAHTPKGGYVIDYRKVRNFNVPDLKNFKLTPYVSQEVNEKEAPEEEFPWEENYSELYSDAFTAQDLSVARRTRAMTFLKQWRQQNPEQFSQFVKFQQQNLQAELERAQAGEHVEMLERIKAVEPTNSGA